MSLSIVIPEAQVVEVQALLKLVRMAPAYDVEVGEQGVAYVALFNDFPNSVETAMRLFERPGSCATSGLGSTVGPSSAGRNSILPFGVTKGVSANRMSEPIVCNRRKP